jgi:hypothetical protein
MGIHRGWRSSFLVIFALIGMGSLDRNAASAPIGASAVQLLSSEAAGRPVVTEHAIFWCEARSRHTSIRGYDLATNTPFLVAERAATVLDLAADANTLAWVERDTSGRFTIVGADLRARTSFPVVSVAGNRGPSEIALDRGVLYYTDAMPGHRGLFARDLASGSERLVSVGGMRPVARDGALVWSEARATDLPGRARWTLHLRTADARHIDTVLAEREAGYLGFGGYDLSGSTVVWAYASWSGDAGGYVYRIADGTTTTLGSARVSAPHIRGDRVVWAEAAAGPNEAASWRVQIYDLGSNAQSLAGVASSAAAMVWGIAAPNRIALTIAADPTTSAQALYLLDLRAAVRFAARPTGAAASACNPALPSSCGQVHQAGTLLADDGGLWRSKGVQFMLPQFGINDKTFRTENYAAARADGSLDYWLGKAQAYLRSNTLRIFVELPYRRADGSLVIPTDHATLLDFAARANARGLRLAISLHNSADWTMTSDRAAWIGGLLAAFSAQHALPAIAYLSADNEINNHCGRGGRDCFDSDGQYNAQPYIDGAIAWVAQFRELAKRHAPQLLITVGVSTEMADLDATRGAFNFFRADTAGRTLASLVDFLAPHNYGGGAAGIIDDLRFVGYAGPVLLEEFGYPTDPYPRSATWTEGPPACRIDPGQPACALTAPFFVEENINALRTKSYAGAVAWMIADMREKDTASACDDAAKPFDLWTGLFAIGGTYCDGGTYSRALGQPKATAVRVCAYYADDLALCQPGVPPKRRMYLPIVGRR